MWWQAHGLTPRALHTPTTATPGHRDGAANDP